MQITRVSIKEYAKRVSSSYESIRKLVVDGKIPATKIGSSYKINVEGADAYFASLDDVPKRKQHHYVVSHQSETTFPKQLNIDFITKITSLQKK